MEAFACLIYLPKCVYTDRVLKIYCFQVSTAVLSITAKAKKKEKEKEKKEKEEEKMEVVGLFSVFSLSRIPYRLS